jgi:hypothetical protein
VIKKKPSSIWGDLGNHNGIREVLCYKDKTTRIIRDRGEEKSPKYYAYNTGYAILL